MDQQENGSNPSLVPKLIILLIAVACAALVVALYHCIRVGWCMQYHRRSPEPPRHRRHAFHFRREEQPSMDNSIADLIPVHKFNRTISDAEGGYDDHTCAICLCEFEEGEEIRTLPECMHSFHAPCIDMWFYSHTSCPTCRTDATPPQHVLMHFIDSDTERPAAHQDLEYRGV